MKKKLDSYYYLNLVFEGARALVQKVHGALSGAKGELGAAVLG